jgi:hypothetical protein
MVRLRSIATIAKITKDYNDRGYARPWRGSDFGARAIGNVLLDGRRCESELKNLWTLALIPMQA